MCLFARQAIQYHSNPSLCPNHCCWRSWSLMVLWRPTRPSGTNTHTHTQDVPFIIENWNVKVGIWEVPRVTGKFGLGVQNETRQRLTEVYQENTLVIASTPSNNTRDNSKHGHHQMVNTGKWFKNTKKKYYVRVRAQLFIATSHLFWSISQCMTEMAASQACICSVSQSTFLRALMKMTFWVIVQASYKPHGVSGFHSYHSKLV